MRTRETFLTALTSSRTVTKGLVEVKFAKGEFGPVCGILKGWLALVGLFKLDLDEIHFGLAEELKMTLGGRPAIGAFARAY